jgi:hypothetical protein
MKSATDVTPAAAKQPFHPKIQPIHFYRAPCQRIRKKALDRIYHYDIILITRKGFVFHENRHSQVSKR